VRDRLLIVLPTRGRPHNIGRVVQAWQRTRAPQCADLLLVIDNDDPVRDDYDTDGLPGWVRPVLAPTWQPMVPKLNDAAVQYCGEYRAVGFAGDDHVPRTMDWARTYRDELGRMGVGIVHGDDGTWAGSLPTEWAMSTVIVQALGRMVPAPVEHLYCDNAIMDLGNTAQCLRYLPRVSIEHMHPAAGKAVTDAGYARVNDPRQYKRDEQALVRWRRAETGLRADAEIVARLRRRDRDR
jgi:hypothetical protein